MADYADAKGGALPDEIPRPAGENAGLRDAVAVWAGSSTLPAPGLQHVRFVQRADCQAFHRALQVFADFK
jgi:hypothetical protein